MFSTYTRAKSEEPCRTQVLPHSSWGLLGNLASTFSHLLSAPSGTLEEEGDSDIKSDAECASQIGSYSRAEITTVTRQAEDPFSPSIMENDTVIIQSSDCIYFFVVKSILSLSSALLSNILTGGDYDVGQGKVPPLQVSTGHSSGRDFVILKIQANSAVIDILLRLLYPIPIPDAIKFVPFIPEVIDHTSLDLASRILECADILKVQRVTDIVADQLLEFCRSLCRIIDTSGRNNTISIDNPNDPSCASAIALYLYALGCRHHLPCLVSAGARASLHFPAYDAHSHLAALDHITGTQLYQLQAFRRDAVARVTSLLNLHATHGHPEALALTNAKLNDAVTCGSCHEFNKEDEVVPASRWWRSFVAAATPILAAAPMSQTIYEQEFFMPFWRLAMDCRDCRQKDGQKWSEIVHLLRQEVSAVSGAQKFDILTVLPNTSFRSASQT